jgi:NDP-sugar pyrophosphorylase family protein
MKSKPLIFVGANTNLSLYAETAERQGYTVAGIFDKDYYGNTKNIAGVPVIGSEEQLTDPVIRDQYNFFIGTNWSPSPGHSRDVEKRKYLIQYLQDLGIISINIIDPSSQISRTARLGQGIYIGYSVYIEPNVQIEDHVKMYYGTSAGHNSKIGFNTVVQRQAGINGTVGSNSYIGMWVKIFNASTGQGHVGNNVVINPGLYVARDVNDNEHVKLDRTSIRIYQSLAETA